MKNILVVEQDGPAADSAACADASGTLQGDPTLVSSSGNPKADEAALRIARSGAPYFRAGSDGSAGGCARLTIGFEAR